MPQENDKNANRVEQFPSHVGLFHRLRQRRDATNAAIEQERNRSRGQKKKK